MTKTRGVIHRRAWPGRTSAVVVLGLLVSGLGSGCDGVCPQSGAGTSRGAWAICAPTEPTSNASDEACCGGLGWCFQASILPASQAGQLAEDSCTAAGRVCVPKELAVPGSVPTSCRSLGDAEGRCLSTCLPVVARQSASLPQSTCESSSRCAPCYDPITGGLTGACNLTSGDAPSESAKVFAPCCGGAGRCVPQDRLTDSQKNQVQRDSCSATNDRCVPQNMLNPDQVPPTCRSVDDAEGRCLSTCLPSVAGQTIPLPQADCEAGNRCVPCFDPVTGNSTGACSTTSKDTPKEPPKLFASCCGAVGRCVPQDQLTNAQKQQVQRDSCSAANHLCVPQSMIGSKEPPPTCRSVDDAEGRCLSACLPSVANQARPLPQSSCDAANRCVPCFDPVTAASTGACSISPNDAPKEPAKVFASCCGGLGRCVPQTEVAITQQNQLQRDSCAAMSDLCVPQSMIGSGLVPPTCRSIDDAEGRCLSACLPSVANRAIPLPQSGCDAASRCAPCFDLVTGNSTGACTSSSSDSPKEPAKLFASCCGGAGRCVPQDQLTSAQTSQVQRDSCSASTDLCVPQSLIQQQAAPTCRSIGNAEGRCLSICLPKVASQASQLPQSSCDVASRCAPCFDPVTGTSTGACSTAPGDGPKEPPYRFPTCCSDGTSSRGTCVPSAQVPASQAANLSADTCAAANLCVPTQKLVTPNYTFPRCVATILLTSGPGACVPDCLPAAQGLSGVVLSSAGCLAREKCVPCTNPTTGSPTGACT